MSNAQDESAGLRFDHYEVERILGRGAMGIVYLARDPRIGRRVALKTLPRNTQRFVTSEEESEFLERFRREAELCGSLVHPNVITLYEVGWDGKRISFLAMEYVEGESLLSLLNRTGQLELEAALHITSDILQGLAYAHNRGVVHRDIKPANILISTEENAKIADFGVARYIRSGGRTMTEAGQLIGTPYYMAPELIAGKGVDAQADLFSVGVVLYEMLAGRKPFEGADLMDVLYNVVNTPAPDLLSIRPDLPHWIAQYLHRLLAKNPRDRFASASAASSELKRLLAIDDPASTNPLLATTRGIPVQTNRSAEETPTARISTDERSQWRLFRWRSSVPTAVGLGVVVALTGALVGAVGLIQREIVKTESIQAEVIDPDVVKEREMQLREARFLYEAGLYEQSVERFRAYRAAHPYSNAAREGEMIALAALEREREKELARLAAEGNSGRSQVASSRKVTRPGGAMSSASTAGRNETATIEVTPQPEEKRSFWSRIFRRPDPAPAKPAVSDGAGQ